MQAETRDCNECSGQFTIAPEDFVFYDKLHVPAPNICPECRLRRRFLFRNERTLYSRICDLCKKPTLSVYHQKSPYTVYCVDCYDGDAWDPLTYGEVYDTTRPFFEQLGELFRRVPKKSVAIGGGEQNINSDYTNVAGYNKNCYMCFNSGYNEDCMYSRGLKDCRDSLDLYYGINAERSYESVNTQESSGIFWGQNVIASLDCFFVKDCVGCSNCFGCVNLRHKEYHFFNEPVGKDEYHRRVSEIAGSFSKMEEARRRFAAFVLTQPHRENSNVKCEDCIGDYLASSKSLYHCFETIGSENCKYCYFNKLTKDSYDIVGYGYSAELILDSMAVGYGQRVIGTFYAENCHDVAYSFYCFGCGDLFGCDGLKKVEYAILNKRYTPEEYRLLRAKIVEELVQDGAWGLFFPPALAPFAYNETIAADYLPISRDEALRRGYRWQEELPGISGRGTMQAADIPDHIRNVPDTIVNEILTCAACGKNYKILKQELEFYRKMTLPLPRNCFNCRHLDRLQRRGPLRLFNRTCSKCNKAIETSFAPDRPEIVYCEACYQREMV